MSGCVEGGLQLGGSGEQKILYVLNGDGGAGRRLSLSPANKFLGVLTVSAPHREANDAAMLAASFDL